MYGAIFDEQAVRRKKHTVRHIMGTLAVQNDDRGGHAWGYALPSEGVVRKGLGLAAKMGRKNFDAMTAARVVVGHTRWATQGAKEVVANAHPFVAGDIIGAHNGVVSNHHELNRKHGRKCEVDSNHIFLHLDEGKDVSELQAYGAITFAEKTGRADEVFIARFNGGTLALAEVPGYGWVWSSQKSHLEVALELAGVPKPEFWEPTENVLVSLTPGDGLIMIGDFEPSSPWRDPKGKSYTRYFGAANDDDYDGCYGASAYGCGYAYISTAQKSDGDKESRALALATGQKAPAMSTIDVETSAADTELEDMLEATRESLAHTTDDRITRELDKRATMLEELILEVEIRLEEAAANGHQQMWIDDLREELDQKGKEAYEEWLADREANSQLLAAIDDDPGRSLFEVLDDEMDIAIEGA